MGSVWREMIIINIFQICLSGYDILLILHLFYIKMTNGNEFS
jgi:hypothetical protein